MNTVFDFDATRGLIEPNQTFSINNVLTSGGVVAKNERGSEEFDNELGCTDQLEDNFSDHPFHQLLRSGEVGVTDTQKEQNEYFGKNKEFTLNFRKKCPTKK